MSDNSCFIKKIIIRKVRHLSNLEIQISDTEKKHLILTGKNASGKTSVLEAIKDYLAGIENQQISNIPGLKNNIEQFKNNITQWEKSLPTIAESQKFAIQNNINAFKTQIKAFQATIDRFETIVSLEFSNLSVLSSDYEKGAFIFSYFDAKRNLNLTPPRGITKFNLNPKYLITDRVGLSFIQYIVNLYADRSFARESNDMQAVSEIVGWFENFQNSLREIFNDQNLKIEFDRVNYNFNILMSDHEKTDLNHLSDGYSSILSIITELILRMEGKDLKAYDLQGIVLIDELETHLHIELQKQIFPFLTKFFPNIQFIITTHSP
ncbi:MAG TPA: AAA family ATPase, partial [Aquella sp.]|nr:AAA family ATPase [Aquella sp.]